MSLQCRSAWVTLAARNFERSTQFYRRLLGQEPTSQIPDYAEFQFPGLRLGIYRPKPDESVSLLTPHFFPPVSLCLQVEELEDAIAHLTQIGYPSSGEITTASHGREIYAYDPDGNRLILYQPCQAQSISG